MRAWGGSLLVTASLAAGLAGGLAVTPGCKGEEVELPLADGGGDGSVTGDGAGADAGADAVAGTELLQNPSLELGCGAGWQVGEGTADEVATARTGASACRVCGAIEGSSFFFGQRIEGPFVEGSSYFGEIWLRQNDQDAAIGANPVVRLEQLDADDNQLDMVEGSRPALDGTWKRSTSLVRIKAGTKRLVLEVWSQNGKVCYLADDGSLRRVP